ncbi:MAG: peptidyl-prolyl cis-trans isomerase [Clostridia bacterium]|nr:peptidyl-prolyl cis-trans isomerase [Clostridia bacterium]
MSENKVLATVKGREITQDDINRLLRSLDPQQALQLNSGEGKKRLLDELIAQELFYLEALENGLDQEEAYIKEVERAKENILKDYAIGKLFSNVKVEEDEVVNYYNEHKEQFKTPESVRASHILVDNEQKANDILNEINEDFPFEEAAKKYSKCPSKARGGDLGYFSKGQMVPEFEQAAFGMKKDEISNPVKTQFGYHLIKLVDRKEAGIKEFNEVKQQIHQRLLALKQNDAYLNKSNELRKKYEVKIG